MPWLPATRASPGWTTQHARHLGFGRRPGRILGRGPDGTSWATRAWPGHRPRPCRGMIVVAAYSTALKYAAWSNSPEPGRHPATNFGILASLARACLRGTPSLPFAWPRSSAPNTGAGGPTPWRAWWPIPASTTRLTGPAMSSPAACWESWPASKPWRSVEQAGQPGIQFSLMPVSDSPGMGAHVSF